MCCEGGIEKEREEYGILLRAVSDDRLRPKKAWRLEGMTHDAARKTMYRCLLLDRVRALGAGRGLETVVDRGCSGVVFRG